MQTSAIYYFLTKLPTLAAGKRHKRRTMMMSRIALLLLLGWDASKAPAAVSEPMNPSCAEQFQSRKPHVINQVDISQRSDAVAKHLPCGVPRQRAWERQVAKSNLGYWTLSSNFVYSGVNDMAIWFIQLNRIFFRRGFLHRLRSVVTTGCAKKWPNLLLSELRQICTKFDNFLAQIARTIELCKGRLNDLCQSTTV